jgi:tetratricopeptide (TPR) repeat protein
VRRDPLLTRFAKWFKKFFVHDPDDEASLNAAQRLAKDVNLLTLNAFILFVGGCIVAAIAAYPAWAGALLECFAFFGVALLFGFLFGIPKSVSHAAMQDGTKYVSEVQVAVNTNLEQISDWLTKIIVGVGLVQLKQLPGHIDALVVYISPLVASAPDAKSFTMNVFMYFSSIGFLTGWVGTRIFLSPVISRADRTLVPEAAKGEVGAELSAPTVNVKNERPPETSGSVDRAANQILESAPNLEDLKKLDDIVAWAQAQLALGHFPDAVRGYKKAMKLTSSDIRVRLGLGVCYYSMNAPIQKAISELLFAESLVTPSTDPQTRVAIYENLAAAYLYTEAPGGYQNTLEYLRKALELNPAAPAALYFYLAAAYGQQYTWRKERGDPDSDLEESRRGALDAARKAVDIEPSMKARLWEIASDPTDIDNDLAPFANDPEFLNVVGRTSQEARS